MAAYHKCSRGRLLGLLACLLVLGLIGLLPYGAMEQKTISTLGGPGAGDTTQ